MEDVLEGLPLDVRRHIQERMTQIALASRQAGFQAGHQAGLQAGHMLRQQGAEQSSHNLMLAEQAVLAACEVLRAGGRCAELPLLEWYLQELRVARETTLTWLQASDTGCNSKQRGLAEGMADVSPSAAGHSGGHQGGQGTGYSAITPRISANETPWHRSTCARQMNKCDGDFRKSLVACWFQIGMHSARCQNSLGQ